MLSSRAQPARRVQHILLALHSVVACATSAVQLESCLNGLEERLRQYHAACHRLGLLPASAKRAAGVAFDLALNRSATTQAELLSGDIKVRRGLCMLLLVRAGT